MTITRDLPQHAEMTRAMLERDRSYEGVFYVCVKTTKIFCRPGCPARKPRVENVDFKASVRECLLGGYRPCRRCRPLHLTGDAPPWLDQLVDRVESAPADRLTDSDLRSLGINPHSVRRYFKRNFNLTFQSYHRARRMGLAMRHIQSGASDIHAALDHGYESLSGFREAFHKVFGVTPVNSRGVACILTRTLDTPLGPVVTCATDDGVCLVEFADRPALPRQLETLKHRLNGAIVPGDNTHLENLAAEIGEYFARKRTRFTVPFLAPGTEFQRAVWRQLGEIPMGTIRTYAQVANLIGRPEARRAVGRACGDNRLAIVIPCHRVVRSDGSLCGYGGGLWRKHYLLNLEREMGDASAKSSSDAAELPLTIFVRQKGPRRPTGLRRAASPDGTRLITAAAD